jgi:uncharacterized RDD family membrane protein YckC
MSSPDFFGSPDHNLPSAIIALLIVLYFAVSEGLWGASPGKAICGIRVVNPRRNAAGVPRALARAAVYVAFPQTLTLACVGLIGAGVISRPPMWLLQLQGYFYFALLALMFSTARRRNGYAGFHDLLSNTRVVLKSVYQPRPVSPSDGKPPEETEATPTVGPYHVLSSLDKTGDSELLLGYDTRLLRKVWIRTLPDDEPAVATDVRDMGRPGRLRWLAGRRAPGECWDAYEAPSGSPLVHLLEEPQPWASVRYWLVDVAEELAAGTRHQSLPAVLALDRIWITPEGRAKLLDFSAPGIDPQGPWGKLPRLAGDTASIGPFLSSVVVAALEGRAVEPEEARRRAIAAPLPLHAKSLLDELPGIDGPEQFARRLKPHLGRAASVTRPRRLGLVAACLAPFFFFASIFLLGLSMNLWWLERHPEVMPLYHCLVELERLDASGSPTDHAQEQQCRAMEVYVAGRFGETISDPAVWSNTFAKTLMTENQRKIAQRALAAHPHPTEKEVADAAAQLQPFLDEMPDGLPGFSDGGPPMLLLALGMALANLIMLVVVPSVICALLFRGGLLMYVFGIAVVTKDGSRASRLRTFWRSMVTWSPCVLLPMLTVLLTMIGLTITWSVYLVLALLIALVAWSASLPKRGIPDRIAGTYPVLR